MDNDKPEFFSDTPFSVPESYFDSVVSRVNNAIKAETDMTVRSVKMPFWRRIAVVAASSAAAVVMLVVGGMMIFETKRNINASVEEIFAVDDSRVDCVIEMLDGYQMEEILADAMLWEY